MLLANRQEKTKISSKRSSKTYTEWMQLYKLEVRDAMNVCRMTLKMIALHGHYHTTICYSAIFTMEANINLIYRL